MLKHLTHLRTKVTSLGLIAHPQRQRTIQSKNVGETTIPTQSKTRKQHIIQEEGEEDLEEEPSIPVFIGKGKDKGK